MVGDVQSSFSKSIQKLFIKILSEESIFRHRPYFHIYYMYMMYAAYMITTTLAAIDGSCVTFSMYFAAMFKTVSYDIEKSLEHLDQLPDGELANAEDDVQINKNLRAAIARQNSIIALTDKFKELFGYIIFGHFLSSSLTICYGGLAIMVNPDRAAQTRYIIYLSCILLELWCYCLGASDMEEGSTSIADSAYFSLWYKTNLRNRKLIALIMVRSQKPVVLNVPFFTPSLIAFSAICRSSASYMVFLQTMMN